MDPSQEVSGMSAFCGLSPVQVHGAGGKDCGKGHSGDQQPRVPGPHLWRMARAEGWEPCFVPAISPTLGQGFHLSEPQFPHV